MNGPEHFRQAASIVDDFHMDALPPEDLVRAQVHATLALAAAVASAIVAGTTEEDHLAEELARLWAPVVSPASNGPAPVPDPALVDRLAENPRDPDAIDRLAREVLP